MGIQVSTTCSSRLFEKTKIITLFKAGKQRNDTPHYCPVSILNITHKVLERLVLNRIQFEIGKILPVEQVGFRAIRSVADNNNQNETPKQYQNECGIYRSHTAAYDIVRRHELLYKLTSVISCKKTTMLIEYMPTNRRYQVFIGDQKSRSRTIDNGLPQSSVFVSALFDIYVHDLSNTITFKFQCADDIISEYIRVRTWRYKRRH